MNKRQVSEVWRYIAVILIAVTVALCVALFTVINTKINLAREEAAVAAAETVAETAAETVPAEEPETDEIPVVDISGKAMLGYWADSAPLKQQLISYVERVTDENSTSFIPVERRIAVFDMDGTLFCETDPIYFVHTLMMHRILDDEGYKERATKLEKQTAEKLRKQLEAGAVSEDLENDINKCVASAFSDITTEEFYDYIKAYKTLPMPGYEGMLRGDAWYQPMIQVVNYLEANDFTVYIVTGTDRIIARGLVHDSQLDIPDSHIIGSDRTMRASGQGDKDALAYTYTKEDRLITGSETVSIDVKMNKVVAISREIGLQPVLSFGNSSGDFSMAEYVVTGNPYESLAFMLCCDDLERENGNMEKAENMSEMCREHNWIPVSMKNDWTTIYGEGVTKKITEVEAAG
ncbi:haloacid dehalogenase-like hydrolase [Oribacterium sp. P6A1]|uniref:haloacid dehalogenase-like hydrolase n=1 Tax=Oribacterium sp. P6A1 TaxID=1410612 RepID=UPI0006922BDC|nr:HAD family hydrolase [Oribacterium sp. P6A1]